MEQDTSGGCCAVNMRYGKGHSWSCKHGPSQHQTRLSFFTLEGGGQAASPACCCGWQGDSFPGITGIWRANRQAKKHRKQA